MRIASTALELYEDSNFETEVEKSWDPSQKLCAVGSAEASTLLLARTFSTLEEAPVALNIVDDSAGFSVLPLHASCVPL